MSEEEERSDFQTPLELAQSEDTSFTDNMRWQLEQDFVAFKHELMGERLDRNTNTWVHIEGKAIMNEAGAEVFINFVSKLANRNLILSNFNEHEVGEFMIFSSRAIRGHLIRNMDRYKIDKHSLDYIDETYKNMVFPSLKRCLNAGEKGFLKPMMRFIESKIHREDETQNQRRIFK